VRFTLTYLALARLGTSRSGTAQIYSPVLIEQCCLCLAEITKANDEVVRVMKLYDEVINKADIGSLLEPSSSHGKLDCSVSCITWRSRITTVWAVNRSVDPSCFLATYHCQCLVTLYCY